MLTRSTPPFRKVGPDLNQETALSQLHDTQRCIVARNDSSWPIPHPFWLELVGKPLAAAAQLGVHGKFCMREWMCRMHGMRGLPRPMRGIVGRSGQVTRLL